MVVKVTQGNNQKINIRNKFLIWISDEISKNIFESIELDKYTQKKFCAKRLNFIETELKKIENLFYAELFFIVKFTKSICWLEVHENAIGSAAFFEIPGCTFFSDLALQSLPPEIIVPKKYACYAIFENLYHEALHHQMHKLFKKHQIPYLKDPTDSNTEYTISWRSRTFTLLEAFHALHVYSSVTPFRARFHQYLKTENSNMDEMSWIQKSYEDGVRMWRDLLYLLKPKIENFEPFWAKFIHLWQTQYQTFTDRLLN